MTDSKSTQRKDEGKTREELLDELAGLRCEVARAMALQQINARLESQIEAGERTGRYLRESEERLRRITETTGDAIYRLRYDTMTYDYMSPAIQNLTGYTPEEINTLGFACLVQRMELRGNSSAKTIVRQRRQGKTGEFRADYLIRMKGGGIKWLRDHSFPWIEEGRGLIGSVGILTDVTEHKHAEAALQDSERRLRLLSAKLLTVQEEERALIARELHDGISQTLAAVKYGIEKALCDTGNAEKAKDGLCAVVPMLQNAIDDVRRIYMGLRPSILDDFGVIAALRWLCREFEAVCPQMEIEQVIEVAEGDIPDPVKLVIFRIAQQAMDNVVRHSQCRSARVSLTRRARELHLAIADDGIGFDPNAVPHDDASHQGIGLASMQERAELSGGRFLVDSTPGQGTQIQTAWPLDARLGSGEARKRCPARP